MLYEVITEEAEFDKALEGVRAEGGVKLPFDPQSPPLESPPPWQHPKAPSVEEARARTEAGRA